MVQPVLGVVVPTIGRATLSRTLDSILSQTHPDQVEVLVVADTHNHSTVIPDRREGVTYLEHDAGYSAWGHPQRNFGFSLLHDCNWLTSIDDDDTWEPNAWLTILGAISRQVADPSPSPIICQMLYSISGRVLWNRPTVEVGNVGTPMFVVPNDRSRLGVWGPRYEGDWDFIQQTVQLHNAVQWVPVPIARIRGS
jgi:glycosyltransferase involved in cell wall biosynthesis